MKVNMGDIRLVCLLYIYIYIKVLSVTLTDVICNTT